MPPGATEECYTESICVTLFTFPPDHCVYTTHGEEEGGDALSDTPHRTVKEQQPPYPPWGWSGVGGARFLGKSGFPSGEHVESQPAVVESRIPLGSVSESGFRKNSLKLYIPHFRNGGNSDLRRKKSGNMNSESVTAATSVVCGSNLGWSRCYSTSSEFLSVSSPLQGLKHRFISSFIQSRSTAFTWKRKSVLLL